MTDFRQGGGGPFCATHAFVSSPKKAHPEYSQTVVEISAKTTYFLAEKTFREQKVSKKLKYSPKMVETVNQNISHKVVRLKRFHWTR